MVNTFKKSQDLYKNRPWLTFLVLVTLGTMVLVVCSLLLGCGSDSTPKGSVSGKDVKTAKSSKAMNTPGVVSLVDQETAAVGAKGKVKQKTARMSLMGMTLDEVEAQMATDRKNFAPRLMTGGPGPKLTPEQMQAQTVADMSAFDPKLMTGGPGPKLTPEQMQAQTVADISAFDPKLMTGGPGLKLTPEQMQAQMAADVSTFDPKRMLAKFPGRKQH